MRRHKQPVVQITLPSMKNQGDPQTGPQKPFIARFICVLSYTDTSYIFLYYPLNRTACIVLGISEREKDDDTPTSLDGTEPRQKPGLIISTSPHCSSVPDEAQKMTRT